MKKTTLHFYKTGDAWRQEQQYNEMSDQGWQVKQPGRLLQRYSFDDTVQHRYRFGVCEARPGSADEISYLAKQARAGWEVTARKGCWILFCKPASAAQADEPLPDGRGAMEALFGKKIKARETLRMWMIVLSSVLMLAGYFTSLLPLLYSFAIPMLLALLVTLQIKYMQEGLQHG